MRVIGRELQSVAHALVGRHLQRIVIHHRAGVGAADIGDQRS